jgi:phosphoglycolate phosphatase-like HAD superfamily hydrolase
MPERKAVIVDIDNTVMSCDERRAALCSEILGRPVAVDEVWRDLYCARLLEGQLQERYFTDFLSTKLMFLDRPYPLAAATLDILRDRGVRIIFLSGRFRSPVDKGRVTLEFMKNNGLYRDCDEAVFKPSADVHDFDFKREAIVQLRHAYDILWAIDDTPRSLWVSKLSGIFCVGITTSYSPVRFQFADMIVENWADVKELVEAGVL